MRKANLLIISFSVLFATLIVTVSVAYCESPCDRVDRGLSNERKIALAPAIAQQLQVSSVNVLQSFKMGKWSIIYVETDEADEAFLFYSGDPIASHYITLWSGGASRTEEQKIKDWVIKSVPGIPKRLAGCFAWHVTKNRDR